METESAIDHLSPQAQQAVEQIRRHINSGRIFWLGTEVDRFPLPYREPRFHWFVGGDVVMVDWPVTLLRKITLGEAKANWSDAYRSFDEARPKKFYYEVALD